MDDPDLTGLGSEGNRESKMEKWAIEHTVGIMEEVLPFTMNISMHLETWLDFPIDEAMGVAGVGGLAEAAGEVGTREMGGLRKGRRGEER